MSPDFLTTDYLTYGSVCSGIEAATVAWHPLGWRAAFYSEIDRFPCALLAHYYDTPNHGDMTRFREWPDAAIDVLVGGTPCQSFSVAGLRKGLADPRGGLALTFLEIARRYRPCWILWENVPGVLSQDGGRAFGSFLGGLAELGYGWAYRVLDAQYCGLAQRRARVFVVGSARGWASAAAVLFEPASLCGHPAPSRETRQTAPTIPSRRSAGGGLGTDFDCDGGLIARSVAIRGRDGVPQAELGDDLANAVLTPNGGRGGIGVGAVLAPVANGLTARYRKGTDSDATDTLVLAHALRAEGFDASEDGTGRGTPLIAFGWQNSSSQGISASEHFAPTLDKSKVAAVAAVAAVRRLTPRECERLQGFPDDYTLIPYRGNPAADGARYKALGNSMAVPVMRWIGERISMVNSLATELAA